MESKKQNQAHMQGVNRPIRYGDHIILKIDTLDGGVVFSDDGILNCECQLKANVARFEKAIFRVCISFQYSAAKEYQEFISEHQRDVDFMDHSSPHFKAINRTRKNEEQQNAAAMMNRFGDPVLFGDIIQFQHVLSGKFITVRHNEAASLERENLRVILDVDGNISSQFRVVARLSIYDKIAESARDEIHDNAEVFLEISSTSHGEDQYLHVSKDNMIPSFKYLENSICSNEEVRVFELNCSSKKSAWRLQLYDTTSSKFEDDIIRSGDVVFFLDPEANKSLHLHDPHTLTNFVINRAPNCRHYESYFKDHSDHPDSNSFWVVEFVDCQKGGAIHVGGEDHSAIKLRHLNSSRFLYFADQSLMRKMLLTVLVKSHFFSKNVLPNISTNDLYNSDSEEVDDDDDADKERISAQRPTRGLLSLLLFDTAPRLVKSVRNPAASATSLAMHPRVRDVSISSDRKVLTSNSIISISVGIHSLKIASPSESFVIQRNAIKRLNGLHNAKAVFGNTSIPCIGVASREDVVIYICKLKLNFSNSFPPLPIS